MTSTMQTADLLIWTGAIYSMEPDRASHRPIATSQHTSFLSGHIKRDYPYLLGELKPDIIGEVLLCASEAKPISRGNYRALFVRRSAYYCRKDFPHILWDKIRAPVVAQMMTSQ